MADQKFKTRISADAGIKLSAETASRALQLDGSGELESSSVTTTELGYLSGVTSAIQTQLNATASATALSDHITDATDAHDASAISNVAAGNLAATDVQGALNELQSDIDNRALDSAVIKKDGSVTYTAAQPMGGFKITGLADPTGPQDAATKAYVDSTAEGLKPKAAVRAATLVAGTLASSFEDADVIDGVTLATGDRILIKNQADATENGIYIVAASGAPTRSTDFDSLSPIDEINGAYTFIQEGTQGGQGWVQTGDVVTIGVSDIDFVYFNSVSGITGGDGITVTGMDIDVDHDGEGLTFSGTQLALELDGATLSKSASGLKLGDTAVTPATLGSASETVTFTVDQQGRLTAASEQSISITGSQVSDFAEVAQDAVGTILVDSASVDFTYTDGTPSITAAVLPAGVDHDQLANFVANEHIDHTTVEIQTQSNSGLSGGGTIAATRSLIVDITGTTAETVPANGDEILIWDTSASARRKMTRGNFLSGISLASAGDLNETSFAAANNQAAAADVTGLAFANGTVRSFDAHISVTLDATADLYEKFHLEGVQKGAAWDMAVSSVGDDSGVVFSITTAGQIQYQSQNSAGFVSNTFKYRAQTTGV